MIRLSSLAVIAALVSPVAAQGVTDVDVDESGVSVTKEDPPVKRSYSLAAIEVLGLAVALNLSAQLADVRWADVDLGTMKKNLQDGFGYDDDPYTTNQLGHPMGGVALFSAARSTGHGFWVSGLYSFGGSLVWELFLENERPSLNDQITTPAVGMLLGEPIHRFTRALLYPGYGKPGWFRKGAATLLDPVAAANRSFYGDAWYREVPPSLYAHFGVGVAQQTTVLGDHARDAQLHLEVVAEHGLTGDAAFTPKRPLDHFEIRGALDINGDDLDGEIYSRGLAVGRGFGNDHNVRGLGGLFTAFDFSNQERVRHSMLGVGPGITAELGFGERGYLQGTAAGYFVPWGAGGGITEDERMDRDYHRGPGAAALGELRLGRRGTGELRVASRLYEIRGTLVDEDEADERIFTTTAGARLSIADHHAVGVEGSYGTRHATFSDGVTADDRVAEGRVFYALTTDGLFH